MSFTLDDLTRYDLELFAVVDYDQIVTNITAFQSSFAINTIPSATVSFAVGDVVRGFGTTSGSFWNNSTSGRPIEIWARFRDPANLANYQYRLLFVGETAGQAISRASNSVMYSVTIRHWLAWLDEGSMYSPNVAPGSAGNATFPATAPELVIKAANGTAAVGGTSLVPKIAPNGPVTAFVGDAWGKLVRPFLNYVTEENPLHEDLTGQTKIVGVLQQTRLQKRVLFALRQLWGADDAKTYSTITNPLPAANKAAYPNAGLPFRTRNADGTARIDEGYLVGSLCDALLQRDAEQLANNTVWSKIVGGYMPMLLAEVWPHVEFARVCPAVGSIRNLSNQYPAAQQGVQLFAKDIFQIELVAEVNRELRGVLITRPQQSLTNIPTTDATTQTTAANYAMFIGQPTGMIVVKQAPPWLVLSSLNATNAVQQPNAAGQPAKATVGTGLDEVDPAAVQKLKKKREDVKKQVKEVEAMAESYAQQLYNAEVLRGRQIQLLCPFTTDLCPGAPIRFQTTIATSELPEDATDEQRAAARDVFLGKIIQLTNVIDIANKTVGTTVLVGSVRTTYEDSLPKYSVATPPLYTHNMTAWPISHFAKTGSPSYPAGTLPPFFWQQHRGKKPEDDLFVTQATQQAASPAADTQTPVVPT